MATACATVERAPAELAPMTFISTQRPEIALLHAAAKDQVDQQFELLGENVLPGVPL